MNGAKESCDAFTEKPKFQAQKLYKKPLALTLSQSQSARKTHCQYLSLFVSSCHFVNSCQIKKIIKNHEFRKNLFYFFVNSSRNYFGHEISKLWKSLWNQPKRRREILQNLHKSNGDKRTNESSESLLIFGQSTLLCWNETSVLNSLICLNINF